MLPLLILLLLTAVVFPIRPEIIEYYWRDYAGEIPRDAFEGSTGLYIGQIPYNGLIPATIYPLRQVAISSGDGHKVETKEGVKILCCESALVKKFRWEYVNVKHLSPQRSMQMVRGGMENGYRLYVGKVYHEGDWKIGKVFPPGSGLQGLRIWYNNGPEYVAMDFQVLEFESDGSQNSSTNKTTSKRANATYY